MKTTELRIGNWVQFRHTETPVLITLADFVREYKEEHLEDYEPIPLTEEWLERFKLYTGDNCFVKEKFCVLCDGELKNYDLRLTFDSDQTIRIKLDYVHQLQNLYFALTGEELQTDETD
jgi:hypothetical protein